MQVLLDMHYSIKMMGPSDFVATMISHASCIITLLYSFIMHVDSCAVQQKAKFWQLIGELHADKKISI